MIPRSPTKRPNIIWIFGDQMRGQAMSYMGDPNVRTPNLDRMVSEGMQFTAAVSGIPLCCPFRGSLITGQYPHNCVPNNGSTLPADQVQISRVFRDNGYHTCYLGKWHLAGDLRYGGDKKLVPESQRAEWDDWLGYDNWNKQWDSWVHGGLGDDFVTYRLDGFETDKLTDLLVERIDGWANDQHTGDGKPFFAVLSCQPPHDPYVAPEDYMRRFSPAQLELRANVAHSTYIQERARRQLAGYYAQIENLDHNVGRVREAVRRNNIDLDTIILFFSDHGAMQGSQGLFYKNWPYEESIRIPFIVAGESVRNPCGGRHPVPINHVDIAPTSLGLAGISKPDFMPGTDYSNYWIGQPVDNEPDSAFLQSADGWGSSPPWRGIVTTDGWKYIVDSRGPWLCFNLHDDPYEQMNGIYYTHLMPERRNMHDRLAAWIHDTGDSFKLTENV